MSEAPGEAREHAGAAAGSANGAEAGGLVGSAMALLFRQRPAVDFTLRWFLARSAPDVARAGGYDDTGPVDGG